MNSYDDIERLTHRYLDGDRSPDTIRVLTVRLDSDPEARVLFHDAMRLQSALQQKAGSARHARSLRFPAQRRPWRPVLALAASLLAAVGLFVYWSGLSGGRPPIVAQITGVVQIGGRLAVVGERLPPDVLAVVGPGSALTVSYEGEDTRLTFAADTRFTARAGTDRGKTIALESGWLTARVAPQPARAPMRFVTPFGHATVQGTDLRLGVTPTLARLDVFEGRVRLTSADDGETADIGAGQMSVLGPNLALKAYAADTDHVDGDLLFHDDFTASLDHWIVEVLDIRPGKPDKQLFRRPFAPDDTEVARYVQHDPRTGHVVLDPGHNNREVKLMLGEPPIPLSSIVMEYRTEYLKDYASPKSDHIEFTVSGYTGYGADAPRSEFVRLPLGIPHRHRLEHIVREDASGKHRAETIFVINDRRMTRHEIPIEWTPGQAMMCSATTAGSKIRILDFSIRRLVPLDPPPAIEHVNAQADLLFRDDFESGTLDRWHSAVGNWSVVPHPDGQGHCLQFAGSPGDARAVNVMLADVSLPDEALEIRYDYLAPFGRISVRPFFRTVDGTPIGGALSGGGSLPRDIAAGEKRWRQMVVTVRNRERREQIYLDGQLINEAEGDITGTPAQFGFLAERAAPELLFDNVEIRRLQAVHEN